MTTGGGSPAEESVFIIMYSADRPVMQPAVMQAAVTAASMVTMKNAAQKKSRTGRGKKVQIFCRNKPKRTRREENTIPVPFPGSGSARKKPGSETRSEKSGRL
jgi:hypothetical protein